MTLAKVLALLLLTAATTALFAYPNGANYEAKTGAPGEGDCSSCHGNLNTGPGRITIAAPAAYVAGQSYTVTVTVQHTTQKRWGFDLTCLNSNGEPAGTFTITDPVNTLTSLAATDRKYMKQTQAGSFDNKLHSANWTFSWVAPSPSMGQVTFYAAGLAANSANGSSGDYTYTTSVSLTTLDVDDITDDNLPTDFELGQNFPNPFNPTTTIEFKIPEAADVQLVVYNVLGQQVKTIHRGDLAAGSYRAEFAATDNSGAPLPSGIYFYRLSAGVYSETRRMALLR